MIQWLCGVWLLALPAQAQTLEHISSYTLTSGDPKFGGVSGLHMMDHGQSFVAVSDGGQFVTGDIMREHGSIVEVQNIRLRPIRDPNNAPVRGNAADAEGLAIREDGRIYISFENYHRVWTYRDTESEAAWLPRADAFKTLQGNSSLEALAIDQDGVIYTIPERSGRWTRPFPIYRYRDGAWDETLFIPRDGKYLVVGADIGPDGKLYILERDYLWYRGFTSRIRRFVLTSNSIAQEEILLTTAYRNHDNLEGISVWRNLNGGIIITLISDDNFNLLQTTQIVEYRLTP